MKPPDDAAGLIRLLALMVRITGLSARDVSAFSWREARLWLQTQETGDATPVSGPSLAPTSPLGSSNAIENIEKTAARQAPSHAEPFLDARVVSRAHEASRADSAAGRRRGRPTETHTGAHAGTHAEMRPAGDGASGRGDAFVKEASAHPPPHAAPAAGRPELMPPERHRGQMQTFVAFEPHEELRQVLPGGLPGVLPGPTPGATGAENTPTEQASREPPASSFSSQAAREEASRENVSGEPIAPIGQSTPDRRVIQLDIRLDEGLKLEHPFSDTAFGTAFDHELDVTVAPLGHFGGQ